MEQKRKRFMLFAFNNYYPGGGKSDVVGSFDTLDEAKEAAEKSGADYREALDLDTGEWTDLY